MLFPRFYSRFDCVKIALQNYTIKLVQHLIINSRCYRNIVYFGYTTFTIILLVDLYFPNIGIHKYFHIYTNFN